MSRVTTGVTTPYSGTDVVSLIEALRDAFAHYPGPDHDVKMYVTATIEWSGSYNPQPHRSTTLTQLDVRQLRPLVATAVTAGAHLQRVIGQRPAKSWHAQLRELTRTRDGYAAADRAGLNVTPRTLLAWLAEERAPTPANRQMIERAAVQLQYDRATRARDSYNRAAGAAADALSSSVAARYGAEVRFRDIEILEFL